MTIPEFPPRASERKKARAATTPTAVSTPAQTDPKESIENAEAAADATHSTRERSARSETTSRVWPDDFGGSKREKPKQGTSDARMRRVMTSRVERRKKKRGIAVAAIVITVIVIILALIGAMFALGGPAAIFGNNKDYEGTGTVDVEVYIPEGSTGTDIGRILYEAGVVKSVEGFTEVFAKNSLAQGIQPGTYKLKKQMSSTNAIAALLNPASKADLKIVIPEGWNLNQVKERLKTVGGFTDEEIAAALKDTDALGLPEEAGGKLEGWLAPDTYVVQPNDTVATVLSQMVALTVTRLESNNIPRDRWQRTLIIGSIIEREVNKESDYAKVARVIENRLGENSQTNQLLQVDASVLYGAGRIGGMPTQEELDDEKNAYNTYKHPGLPPTAIGAVGEKAMQAANNPVKGDWQYYTTVNLETGETKFANTLQEHEKNGELLAQYCEANPKICNGESKDE